MKQVNHTLQICSASKNNIRGTQKYFNVVFTTSHPYIYSLTSQVPTVTPALPPGFWICFGTSLRKSCNDFKLLCTVLTLAQPSWCTQIFSILPCIEFNIWEARVKFNLKAFHNICQLKLSLPFYLYNSGRLIKRPILFFLHFPFFSFFFFFFYFMKNVQKLDIQLPAQCFFLYVHIQFFIMIINLHFHEYLYGYG